MFLIFTDLLNPGAVVEWERWKGSEGKITDRDFNTLTHTPTVFQNSILKVFFFSDLEM